MDAKEIWEKYENEFLKFDRVENKLSQRHDLHAFMLLDKLVPSACDIIEAAEHDQFYIQTPPKDLMKVATEEQCLELIRSGLAYDSGTESFYMFA